MRYLVEQNILVEQAASDTRANGFDYTSGKEGRVQIKKGDFVISTKQPLGNLVRVLFEPSPELEDSVTYDITAWEMHYAYGVEGFALKNDIETTDISFDNLPLSSATNEKPYAYIAKWNSMDDMKFLAALLNENIRPRFVEKGFSLEGKNYEAGIGDPKMEII